MFLGNVANVNMPPIYRSADILVLHSFMKETSITVLESRACGLPLVGTRVGGIPVLIDDESTGLVVEPGDPVALAEGFMQLVRDPVRLQTMGKAARERVERNFRWESNGERAYRAYCDLLGTG